MNELSFMKIKGLYFWYHVYWMLALLNMNTFDEEKVTFESWFCYFYLYIALRHAPLETTGSYSESEQFLNNNRINQAEIELGRKSTEIQFYIYIANK